MDGQGWLGQMDGQTDAWSKEGRNEYSLSSWNVWLHQA